MTGKSAKDNQPSFWTTLPGILTGLAALITAITGLILLFRAVSTPAAVVPTAAVGTTAVATTTPSAVPTAPTTTGSISSLSANFTWLGEQLIPGDFHISSEASNADFEPTGTGEISITTGKKAQDLVWVEKDLPKDTRITVDFAVDNTNGCEVLIGFGDGNSSRPLYFVLMDAGAAFFKKRATQPLEPIVFGDGNSNGRLRDDGNSVVIERRSESVIVTMVQKGQSEEIFRIPVSSSPDMNEVNSLNSLVFQTPSNTACHVLIKSIIVEN